MLCPLVGRASDLTRKNPPSRTAEPQPVVVAANVYAGNGYTGVRGMAVDPAGNVYVWGVTTSSAMPADVNPRRPRFWAPHSGTNLFFAKLSHDLKSVDYTTYGTVYNINPATERVFLVPTAGDSLYIAMEVDHLKQVTGADGAARALRSVYVVKLDDRGSTLSQSKEIQCTGTMHLEGAALDRDGNLVIAGDAACADFPMGTAGYRGPSTADGGAFVMRLAPDLQTTHYAALVGGTGEERVHAFVLDEEGRAYVGGATASPDFPVTEGAWKRRAAGRDAFVFQLSADGKALDLSTALGGSGDDAATGLALPKTGQIQVLVRGTSVDFPTATSPGNAAVWQPGPHQDASVSAQTLLLELSPGASGLTRSSYVNLGYSERVWLELDGKGRTVVQRDCLYCAAQTTADAVLSHRTNASALHYGRLAADWSGLEFSSFLPSTGAVVYSRIRRDGKLVVALTSASVLPPTADLTPLTMIPDSREGIWVGVFDLDQARGCQPELFPGEVEISNRGGGGSVSVTIEPGCLWIAASDAGTGAYLKNWSGIGSGAILFSVPPSQRPSQPRNWEIRSGTAVVRMSQAALPCSSAMLAPAQVSIPGGGGWVALQTLAPSGCEAGIRSDDPWFEPSISAASNPDHAPSASVSAPRNDFAPRASTIHYGSASMAVLQEGGTCQAELAPVQRELPAEGGAVEFTLTTSRAECAWRAYLQPSMASLNFRESVGSAVIRVSVPANPFNTPREAVLSVAGKAALLKQAAGTCNFAISPERVAFPPQGGTVQLTITATGAGCRWNAGVSDSWVELLKTWGSSEGSGTLEVRAGANEGAATRSGTLRVLGRTILVEQPSNRLSPLTMKTSPPGIPIQVNGQTVVAGSAAGVSIPVQGAAPVQLSAPLAYTAAAGKQFRFVRWSHGGARESSFVYPAGAQSYTLEAVFDTYYRTTTSVEGSGTAAVSPAMSDGFHREGTALSLSAAPATGWVFAGWSGDATGGSNPLNLVANAARGVVARFTLAPSTAALIASPASVTWTYRQGSSGTAAVSIALQSPNGPNGVVGIVRFGSPTVSCAGAANLLSVALSATQTPATLTVTLAKMMADGRTPGSLSCSLAVPRSDGGQPAVLSIPIALEVQAPVPAATISAVVDAASYRPLGLAPGSIATVFGTNLAGSMKSATGLPLPTEMAGTELRLAMGTVAQSVPLFYVAPGQINFLVPEFFPTGAAELRLLRDGQQTASIAVTIEELSPSLFSANADGKGAPAGYAVSTRDGKPVSQPLALCQDGKPCTAAPLSWGDPGTELYVVLFGTGWRRLSVQPPVAFAGGVPAEVRYCGAQGEYAGLDQINLRIPPELAGRGEVALTLQHGGFTANPLRLHFAGR